MKILFLYLLTFSFGFLLFEIYQPEEIFDYLNKEQFSEEDQQFIIDNLIKVLEETYAFYELSKNPPQPDFDNNYHNKVDIRKELKEIKLENKTKYAFYQDLTKTLNKLKDGHIHLGFLELYFTLECFLICFPLKFF